MKPKKKVQKRAKRASKETMYIVVPTSGCDMQVYPSKADLEEAFDNQDFDVDVDEEILEVTVTKRFRADRKLELVEK